jgi:hypothetical protein
MWCEQRRGRILDTMMFVQRVSYRSTTQNLPSRRKRVYVLVNCQYYYRMYTILQPAKELECDEGVHMQIKKRSDSKSRQKCYPVVIPNHPTYQIS